MPEGFEDDWDDEESEEEELDEESEYYIVLPYADSYEMFKVME